MEDHSRLLIQVCQSMANPKTRKREITALAEAMSELKINSGTIVTRAEDEQLEVEAGVIDIVPAYRFLLNLPEKI
jgi:predicted AAA+ superfamily ATPase